MSLLSLFVTFRVLLIQGYPWPWWQTGNNRKDRQTVRSTVCIALVHWCNKQAFWCNIDALAKLWFYPKEPKKVSKNFFSNKKKKDCFSPGLLGSNFGYANALCYSLLSKQRTNFRTKLQEKHTVDWNNKKSNFTGPLQS